MTELYDDLDGLDSDNDEMQQKIAAFNDRVKKVSKVLLSAKAGEEKRVKAAQWLGESGAPEAIEPLVKVYEKDPNPNLKKAAAYALGQFKALDNAIKRDDDESISMALGREENEHIVQLLTDITLEGKIGKRRGGVPVGLLTRLMGLLVVTLVVLIVLNVMQLGGGESTADATPRPGRTQVAAADTAVPGTQTPVDEIALSTLDSVDDAIDRVRQIAMVLRENFTAAENDTTNALPGCELIFGLPGQPITVIDEVASVYPELVTVAEGVNASVAALEAALNTRNRICERDGIVVVGEFRTANPAIDRAQSELDTLSAQAAALRVAAETGSAPVLPTTPLETATPTLVPTATLEPQVIDRTITDMINVVQDMAANRGPGGLLEQFWQDVVQTGETDGCRDAAPTIPDDIAPLSADVLAALPELEQARQSVNLSLQLLRDGWTLFTNACSNGSLVASATGGVTYAQTVNAALNDAQSRLLDLQSR
ncbi:MAG: hypothetical protein OHK0046_10600 [Anaerolineae bacterium]